MTSDRPHNSPHIDEMKGFLGEGFHTAFRKVVDSDEADEVWHLIDDLPDEDWNAVMAFVGRALLDTFDVRRRQ